MTPLALRRPRPFVSDRPNSLLLARKALRELSHSSSALTTLSESISAAVSRTISRSTRQRCAILPPPFAPRELK